MKKFNLEEAKKGHKIRTKAGLLARIICFDACNATFPIVALIYTTDGEKPVTYTTEGKYREGCDSDYDLVLDVEKHEGWINLYRDTYGIIVPGSTIHTSKKEAIKHAISSKDRVGTIRIEWEE